MSYKFCFQAKEALTVGLKVTMSFPYYSLVFLAALPLAPADFIVSCAVPSSHVADTCCSNVELYHKVLQWLPVSELFYARVRSSGEV